ncbi:hypothetical protein [Hydrogenophaga sp.]|uniref:hypothetical protein n=1 Tax=Hydrogenophaga sp. TaxID=1904254 RepID=UPI002725EB75|nr:hypothetical protein [Hydrogenophaga sp.]MDO9505103.1 hypothetical protein [Hydrogenophaga sp.]
MSRVALPAREFRPGREGPRRRRRDGEGETEPRRESGRLDERLDERLASGREDMPGERLESRLDDSLTTESAEAWPRYMSSAAPGARRTSDEGSEPLPAAFTAAPAALPQRAPTPAADALVANARSTAAVAGRDADAAVSEARSDESVDRDEEAAASREAAADETDAEAEAEAAAEGEDPAAEAGASAAGAARRRGFRWAVGEEAQEVEIPPELIEQAEIPLEASQLEWQALSPDWQAPQALPADALPMPAPASVSATASRPKADQDNGKPGDGKQAEGRAAGDNSDPAEKKRSEIEARDKAKRGYLDLVNTARSEQEGFVNRANQITNYMAQAYGIQSQDVMQAHGTDLSMLDAAAARASASVESAASFAEQTLDAASQDTTEAIAAAGRSAYGLINADDTTAAARISTVVSGLVSGHQSAYNSAIDAVTFAADDAVIALNAFRDERATNYPVGDPDALEGAKNETRQARIPGWVEPVVAELIDRSTAKTTEWDSTRNSTVCGLTCSYSDALETERTRVNEQGRASVASALTRARGTLRDQTRDGRKALRDLRRSYLTQIDTQRQATRSRLNSQARGTLMGLKQESQGAVGGVQGAARGAMPTYWRGALGLEQSLRGSVNKGAQALSQTAEKAPPGILQSARRAGAQMDERLNGNLARLEGSLGERRSTLAQQNSEQLAQFDLTMGEQTAQATTQIDQSANGLVTAFSGLASSVSQAAASWAQPLSVRLAGFIATKQGEAQAALTQVLTGQPPTTAGGDGGGGGVGGGEGGGASCGSCESAAGGSSGPAAASGGGGGAGAAPKGLTEQADDEIAYANERGLAEDFFADRLDSTGAQVETNLETRSVNVAQKFEGGFAGSVDEEGVIAVLRGLTPAKGHALDVSVYPGSGGGTLDSHLQHYLEADSDDYATASAYLRGDAREGARRELADSTGFFNDDEARIEATMRALSPDDLAALGRDPAIMEDVRGALDGTDVQVFDSLIAGDYAAADAYRMRDAVDAARRDGNADAVHSAIEQDTGAPGENDWRSNEEMSAEDRRTAVVAALGGIVSDADVARGAEAGADISAMSAEDRAVAYVTRDIEVYVGGHGPEGQPHTVTLRMAGANRDLAGALLRHGESSLEARAARLGVEMQRMGDPPNATNIDRAMFDERFTPDSPNATPEERAANERNREAARRDRARVMLLAGHYAPAEEGGAAREPVDHDAVMAPGFVPNADEAAAAQRNLIGGLRDRFGSDGIGADLAEGLLTDERPSARTASLAMQHAMYSRSGTNEDLLFRFTERMNRDEIAAMRTQFQTDTGNSLDAELGVYGEGGTFTELSGDDRLRMERAMRGVARTDQERLENAAYALHQQRHETGAFGAWLAEGTLAERVMINTERRIERLAGGPIEFSRRGELTTALPNFAAGTGNYTGPDRDRFLATTAIAQTVAENYSKRIDAFADVATTGIAILGAIAAAVITVATGGAAGPLIAAALVAGLASMAANAAIKGGRYGWEQAAVDLGMTAVQALTAGVGAQLGAAAQVASKGATAASAASRSLSTLARLFTGNPVVDQIIVGAITGSIGGVAGAAFDERTWERSGGDAVGALFSGLLKGALSGAGTAALSNSVEALGRNGAAISARARELAARGGIGARTAGLLGRGLGRAASGLDEALNVTTTPGGGVMRNVGAVAARSVARGTVSSVGAMGGRTTEILYDSAAGKYRGDAGDALLDIGAAGRQAFIQGMGEGAGESFGARVHARTTRRTETAIASARAEMGLPPMSSADLGAAAADLLFMNQHGRNGSDRMGRAINLDHIASSGPLDAPIPLPHATDAAEPAATRPPAAAGSDAADGTPRPAAADTPAPLPAADGPHPAAVRESDATVPPPQPQPDTPPPSTSDPATQRTPDTDAPAPHATESAAADTSARRAAGGPDDDRLFPNLTDAEIDAAFAAAESRLMVRVGADQPGADARPLRPAAEGELTLQQRQRAGALTQEADATMARANQLLDDAIAVEAQALMADTHNPRRAAALRERADGMARQAAELETQAGTLRAEAAEFSSGRRSATDDLPGPDDFPDDFSGLTRGDAGPQFDPTSQVQPRDVRPLLEGENGGRLVFRVESERSRSLVTVDADGNVTVEGGAFAHLNFGSFERAVEFVLNNSEGNARIIAFEVDEAWARSMRSTAVPENGADNVTGVPQLVDVRFAHDQLGIPPELIPELNQMIIPGSGRVFELPAPGPRPTGGDAGGGEGGGGRASASAGSPDSAARTGAAPASPDAARSADAPDAANPMPPPTSESETRRPGFEDAVRAEAEAQNVRGPNVDESGHSTTAAAIEGSQFHGGEGSVIKRNHAQLVNDAATAAVRDLIGPQGQFAGMVQPTRNDPNVLRIAVHGGGELQATVKVGHVPPNPDGSVPVARYERNGDRVTIVVSERASPAQIQRALAHEFAELRFNRHARADTLRPGGKAPTPPDVNTHLSRHDRGRIAEIEQLARQIEAARSRGDGAAVTRLQDEAGRLVAHLGLVHGEGAPSRTALARAAMPPESAGARLLGDFVEAGRRNPMLEPLGTGFDDLSVLARQADYQRTLGRTGDEMLQRASRMVVEDGLMSAGRPDVERIAALRDQLPDDAARALLDQAVDNATRNWQRLQREVREGGRGRVDRMEAEIARQRFGDHPNFQDFEVFRNAYLNACRTVDGDSPDVMRRLFNQWVHGAFVTDNGGIRGISIGVIRAEAVDHPTAGVTLRGDAVQEGLAQTQRNAMAARDDIEAELAGRPLPSGEAPSGRTPDDLSNQMRIIRDSGEDLGTRAAEKFAADVLGGPTAIPLTRTGAGVPDLVFDNGGRLILIEAKGPQADLGFRRTADGRRTEQGTPEYLESLARDMMRPRMPPDRQLNALGARLLAAVRANPPAVDYYVVRQPLGRDGRPGPIEAQKFDLVSGRTSTPTTSRTP